MMGKMPDIFNVVVNANHKVIQKIIAIEKEEDKIKMAKQAYDLALLSQGMLTGKDLTDFVRRSVDLASN